MKKLSSYILTILGLLNFSVLIAQQTPPAGSTPKDFKLPEKKTKSFANGFHATMVQYGVIPKTSISLIIKTGNVHEGANEVWLADLTGQMMKQGTSTMDFKTLSKKAAQMGGDLNISVGSDQITITGTVLSEYAPEFIKLIANVVMKPAFPATELERLKGDLKRQLKVQKAVPQSQAAEKFAQVIYKDHPYGRYFPTEEMLNGYTLQMVKDFYNKNFGAKRSVLYIAGKFNEATVVAATNSAFSTWKAGPEVQYPAAMLGHNPDTIILDRKNAPQTTVMLGLPTLTPKDKDYFSQVVANSLLGGSFGSRITTNIREDKGYTYSPFSAVRNHPGSSVWVEQADVTSEHTVDALVEIQKEITRLQNEPPSQEELTGTQKYEAGIFVLRNSAPSAIINQLNFMDLYHLDDSYLADYVKNIYKVTPEKVSQIAKNNLQYQKMTLIMVGDRDTIQKQINAVPKKAF